MSRLLAALVLMLVIAATIAGGAAEAPPADRRGFQWSHGYGTLVLYGKKPVRIVSASGRAATILKEELEGAGVRRVSMDAGEGRRPQKGEVPVTLIVRKEGDELPDHDEAYSLVIDKEGVHVRGATEQGLIRGVAALARLVRDASGDAAPHGGIHLPFCSAIEAPDFPFRAVHITVNDRREIDFYRQVIRDAFLHRFNAVILEISLNMALASHPELTDPVKTLTREEVRSLIATAEKYSLEAIPAVNSFGHQSKALFAKHPDFYWNVPGQDPDNPACDPANPRVRDFYFDVYREIIEVFRPRYFHIGHDEVVPLKGFPPREAAAIYADSVLRLHRFLGERKIRTMMWGDMLLKGDVTGVQDMVHGGMFHSAGAIDRLPRDIVILDCHYRQDNPEFRSSRHFIDKGFPVVGATFEDPRTTANFAGYLRREKEGVMGMCATLWYRVQWRHFPAIREILGRSEEAFWRARR